MLENTDPKVKYIFEALDKSGVTMTDFSRITRISRETLYRWKKGNAITDRLRLDFAYTAAIRLEKGCRLGRLPIQEKLKKEQRLVVLRKIIAEMASK